MYTVRRIWHCLRSFWRDGYLPLIHLATVVERLLLWCRLQMDAEKAHSLLCPKGDVEAVWYRAFIGGCEMQVKFIIDATRREKEYFRWEMFNCPDRCFAEVVMESPLRRMDDAVEVRVIVDPRHGGILVEIVHYFDILGVPLRRALAVKDSGFQPSPGYRRGASFTDTGAEAKVCRRVS